MCSTVHTSPRTPFNRGSHGSKTPDLVSTRVKLLELKGLREESGGGLEKDTGEALRGRGALLVALGPRGQICESLLDQTCLLRFQGVKLIAKAKSSRDALYITSLFSRGDR